MSEYTKEFLINAGELVTSLKELVPFVSKEETRYYLNGALFELEDGGDSLNLAATDGHKLCVITLKVDPATDNAGAINSIVPIAAMKTMLQMLKGIQKDWPISIKFNDAGTLVHIDAGDQKAEFKLIDGQFPDYRKVIPDNDPKFCVGLAKAQAVEATKAVSAHKGKDALEWQFTDEHSPIKLLGDNKTIVVMPCRVSFDGADIGKPNSNRDSKQCDLIEDSNDALGKAA